MMLVHVMMLVCVLVLACVMVLAQDMLKAGYQINFGPQKVPIFPFLGFLWNFDQTYISQYSKENWAPIQGFLSQQL